MIPPVTPAANSDNEWSPLRSIIVGRAEHSCFPSEPARMIEATMPEEYVGEFKPNNPFPPEIVKAATEELDNLARILEAEGIHVYRPKEVNWTQVGGYTGAMPRDGLMTVGNTVIESVYAWECRRQEIKLGFTEILDSIAKDPNVTIVRRPSPAGEQSVYEKVLPDQLWAIDNTRPAFDTADFLRFGKVLIGQLSHVTNMKGVEYLRKAVPEGYTVELIDVQDKHAMHIDTTIAPLREGLLLYNPERTSEEILRKHDVLKNWEMHPYPGTPKAHAYPPLYMTSAWLTLNFLVLDGHKIVIEEQDTQLQDLLRSLGMEPILCPMRNVYCLGGSLHCATVDIVRESR
ncbi:hypothetical protein FQN54_008589 [Arachnomyces sp. PD_36]|nr:hypothetical protein FQN54_008589 [Arachnomyces sp. PD_36]